MRGLRAVRITPGIRWTEQAIRLIVRAATRIRNRTELKTSNHWRPLKTSVQPPYRGRTLSSHRVLRAGSAAASLGICISSEPMTPRIAITSMMTMATRIDDRRCQSPSRPRSTRSIAEGLAAAAGACAGRGGAGGC